MATSDYEIGDAVRVSAHRRVDAVLNDAAWLFGDLPDTWAERMKLAAGGTLNERQRACLVDNCVSVADQMVFASGLDKLDKEGNELGMFLFAVFQVVDHYHDTEKIDFEAHKHLGEDVTGHIFHAIIAAFMYSRQAMARELQLLPFCGDKQDVLKTLEANPSDEDARSWLLRCGQAADGKEQR